MKNGSVNNWRAVGGAALQGGITGGVAGLTGGASLVATIATGAAANAVGGAASNAIQGKQITAGSVAKDLAIGAAGGVGGKLLGGAINKLSPSVKGKIGEFSTKVKFLAKGSVSEGKAVVATGGKTSTGRVQTAIYDHKMVNKFTGKVQTVESKFNTAGLTANQKAAANRVSTSGGLIVDRTTGNQVGNTLAGAVTGAASNQTVYTGQTEPPLPL